MRSLLLTLLLIGPLAAQPSVRLGSTSLAGPEGVLAVFFTPESDCVGIIETSGSRAWTINTGQLKFQNSKGLNREMTRIHCCSDGGICLHSTNNDKHTLSRTSLNFEDATNVTLPTRPETVLFSETGSLAAVEYGREFSIVRMQNGETLATFGKLEGLRRFSASRDGRTLAFCTRDGEARVYRATELNWCPPASKGHRFSSVALSPDGTMLATATFTEIESLNKKLAGPVKIWSVKDKTLLTRCENVEWFAEYPNRLRFSPDGRTLLAGDGAYLRGWDTTTGVLRFAVEPGWNYSGPIVISPDSRYVAVAYSKKALVWDLTTGQAPPGFETHTGPVWDLAIAPDGTRSATTSYGHSQVIVWNPTTGKAIKTLNAAYRAEPIDGATAIVPGRVRVHFSPDGRLLATVNEATGGSGPIRVWDSATGRKLWEVPVERWFAPEVAWVKGGLAATTSPTPCLYDRDTGTVKWTSDVAIQATGLIVSRDGVQIAIEEKTGVQTLLLDADSGRKVEVREGVPYRYTPHGLISIKLGPNMTNGLFKDLVTLRTPEGRETEIGSMPMGTALGRLSPDGAFRVGWLEDRFGIPFFEIREVAGDRRIAALRRLENVDYRAAAFTFSPDHRLFAAISVQGSLAVWDALSGAEILQVETGYTSPRFLMFSPDSRTVFTTSGDGGGSPVDGYDTAGGHAAKPNRELDEHPALARQAVYELAKKPADAVALAKAILSPASADDLKKYETAIGQLAAPAFADREAATRSLAEAGWRVSERLRAALASESSAEARDRLESLLLRRDLRPFHCVHLLELAGTSDASAVLKDLAAREPETLLTREARRVLARMTPP